MNICRIGIDDNLMADGYQQVKRRMERGGEEKDQVRSSRLSQYRKNTLPTPLRPLREAPVAIPDREESPPRPGRTALANHDAISSHYSRLFFLFSYNPGKA